MAHYGRLLETNLYRILARPSRIGRLRRSSCKPRRIRPQISWHRQPCRQSAGVRTRSSWRRTTACSPWWTRTSSIGYFRHQSSCKQRLTFRKSPERYPWNDRRISSGLCSWCSSREDSPAATRIAWKSGQSPCRNQRKMTLAMQVKAHETSNITWWNRPCCTFRWPLRDPWSRWLCERCWLIHRPPSTWFPVVLHRESKSRSPCTAIRSNGHVERIHTGLKLHDRWYLIGVSVTADDDRGSPTGDQTRNVLADDGLAENSSTQNISDGSVWRLPHLFQIKLYENIRLTWKHQKIT